MRSDAWYKGKDRDSYIHRAWMRRGLPNNAFDGRPHIAIANTASDLAPCNSHLNEVMEYVKNGIWEAGGVPLNMPAVSLGETQVRPTAMLWRNMSAMATEELLRANPIDGVVLLGGCDKTIPALLMAAASVDLPAIVVPGGPMLTGTFKGKPLGCGTDVWKFSEELRAGKMSEEDFLKSEQSMIRSRGHCNTMGTASTMGCVAEALGMTIPGVAGTPAPDSRLLQTEVELTTAETSLQVALTRLEQYSGEFNLLSRIANTQYPVTLAETNLFSKQLQGVDWRAIASDHPVSAKARIEVIQVQRRLEAKESEALPQMFVRLYKPIGTIPSSTDTSTTAFLGMRYSPGAGFSTYAEAKSIATRMDGAQQSVEAAIRDMQQTLQNDREEFVNARSRIAALEKSVASSALVLESYQRQFQAGRKQWQDLLNQVRELAQNQYALADAQASMVGSMYRLQIRMGQDPK